MDKNQNNKRNGDKYQETRIDLLNLILRHEILNPNRNLSLSLNDFLFKIDNFFHDSIITSSSNVLNKSTLNSCPNLSIEILKVLYKFCFEPTWSPYFFPRNSFIQTDNQADQDSNSIPICTLPKIDPKFNLNSNQGEESFEYSQNRRGQPCGHVFQKGEGVYHCSDCGIDPTCALCAKCFLASEHIGHDITYSIHGTGCGCCDCGDEEAWKVDIKCKYHSHSPNQSSSTNSKSDSNINSQSASPESASLPIECKNLIEEIVTVALDFLIITLDRCPEDMSPPSDAEAISHELTRLEENSYIEISRCSSSVPDNSMDVDLQFLNHNSNPYYPHQQSINNSIEEDSNKLSSSNSIFSALLSGRAFDKGKGKITDTSASNLSALPTSSNPTSSFGLIGALAPFNSASHPIYSSANSAAQGSSSSTGEHWLKWASFPTLAKSSTDHSIRGVGPWGVVLWNDEKHSYAQVIDQVSKAIGCSRLEALNIANTVDTKGRAVIEVSNNPSVLLQTSKMISRIDLTVTVRTAHDLLCEQVADLVINFLVDLASCRIYNVFLQDESWIKRMITQKLCEKPSTGYEGGDRTRFARLLLNDVKLWKDARDKLKSLYISLLALGQSVKLRLGVLFVSVFPQLIEYNLLVDREPEHNILLFSLQIVTVPSVITVLVTQHGFLKVIIDLLYSFFTHQFLPVGVPDNEFKHIVYPPDYNKKTIDPEGMSFRHKRYYHLFHELNLVLSSAGVQHAICEDITHLNNLIDFLDLFTNMNPNKRAVHLHVEFESDAWVTAFNLTIQLSKLCKCFGESYLKATPRQFVLAIRTLSQKLLRRQHEFHKVKFGSCETLDGISNDSGVVYRCINFKTDRESISFHHPLNWLLAEMMRSVHQFDFNALNDIGVYGIGDLLIPNTNDVDEADIAPLVISEDVIRVSSLLSQVRAGLWVRNGFGVRAQQLHYREYSLRETTFDQDIFHLQFLLAAKDPSHVLVAIVDRFGLWQWCNGELLTDRVYEPSQMIAMLEELLHLLIILLSEPSGIGGLSQEENMKREIIHALCLGSLSYSEIIKRIPDRYMQDSAFEKMLNKLTDFKAPVGTNDIGIYALKIEHLDEVDPYYCRFGRNQREESERIVVEYLKKSKGDSDPVLVPKSLNINSGPFACINQTYHSEVLLQIIFYSLARVNPTMKGYSDYLADQALHLVMMGLVEQPQSFANMAIEKKLPLKGANPHTMSLMMLLEAVEGEPAMKSVKKKVNWCLDRLASIAGFQRQGGGSKEAAINAEQMALRADELKKEAAKARQNAIMNQFAAAQQAFLLQHDFGDEDDEEEENDEDDDQEEEEEEGDNEDDDDDDNDELMLTNRAVGVEVEKVYGSCIVCQEDLTTARCFGALGLVQCSRIIRRTPFGHSPAEVKQWFQEALMTPESLDVNGRTNGPSGLASIQLVNLSDTQIGPDGSLEPVSWTPQGFPTCDFTKPGFFASACGHLMHLACFQTYYKSIELRHSTQVTRNHPESIERCEYLCPLCKSIGNVFLPSIDLNKTEIKAGDRVPTDLASWLSLVQPIERKMKDATGTTDYTSVLLLSEEGIEPWFVHSQLPSPFRLSVEDRTMLERFLTVTGALGQEIELVGQMTLTRDLVGYTIACMEIANRGVAQPMGGVASSLTETQRQLIGSLLALLGWLIETETGEKSAKLYATALLIRQLIPPIPAFEREGPLRPVDHSSLPVFVTEPFPLLVHCAAVCYEALSLIIPLCYYAELIRVLVGLCYYSAHDRAKWWEIGLPENHRVTAERVREGKSIRELLKRIVKKCNIVNSAFLVVDDLMLERLVRLYTLPFLRRAMILRNVINERESIESGTAIKNNDESHKEDEHVRLRRVMKVPSVAELLGLQELGEGFSLANLKMMRALTFGWLDHFEQYSNYRWKTASSNSNHFAKSSTPLNFDLMYEHQFMNHFELEHPVIYELLGLPRRFDKLLSQAAMTKCLNCKTVPNDPGICLFCGATVCVQAFCCTNRNLDEELGHGECNVHLWNCGGSVGIYLLIKKCSTLYLSTENGSLAMAPYLDEHGEHDVGMKRGKPQFLHQTRWDEIRKIWLLHLIPTYVARKQESSSNDVGGWPTF
ncbi:hypothetical protein O181_018002 [Austropuccinia psidii MF-1]|uniref:E3 ubiquitin-protein ligase n=1 Tax=Austropuccinia psidii MF-1 TaxID=1389203 RepID=A0A9Q3GT37_9BASI|nr:hypothetical protein [Austropuccinia psidii MF-1]